MLAAAAHRGPDTVSARCFGPIGLGIAVLHTTPESLLERQPLANDRGTLSIVFDGRIDNRDELSTKLRDVRTGSPDAAIVLRAYEQFGIDAFALLLGDFAAVIWDDAAHTLICARDALGIRPLVYTSSSDTFACASEIKQLFASGLVDAKPNPGFLGELLSYQPTSLDETLYRGILRLPPAHVMTVTARGISTTRFFDFDPERQIRYATDREYAEHFRELFQRSVTDRLRAIGDVSVFLSGGLDSSAIVGMARKARHDTPALAHISLLSVCASQPAADERVYAESVARMWGLPLTTIPADVHVRSTIADDVRRAGDFPDAPNTPPWAALLDRAHAAGSRVVFWGHGGDEWFTGDASHSADLLAQFDLRGALRQLRSDLALANGWGGALGMRDALRWTLLPLAPRWIKRIGRLVLPGAVPTWVDRQFASEIDLAARLRRPRPRVRRFPTAAQQAIYAQFENGWAVLERELHDRFCARSSMEARFPFHDRRLIEFGLAIPESQRWRGSETKFVLRGGCRDLLPDPVRERRTKADFSFMFADMIARETSRGFPPLRLAADGYVNAAEAERVYDRYRRGSRRDLDTLWIILTMEAWYSTMFPEGGCIDRSVETSRRLSHRERVA